VCWGASVKRIQSVKRDRWPCLVCFKYHHPQAACIRVVKPGEKLVAKMQAAKDAAHSKAVYERKGESSAVGGFRQAAPINTY
jgi:hypothetical protein